MTPSVARARARYEAARTILAGLLVLVVLATLGLLVAQSLTIRQAQRQIAGLAEESKRESAAVAELLAHQQKSDADRQRRIDAAVAAIAAEQYRAMVAHDTSVKEYLSQSLRLIQQEVNAPANRERPPRPGPVPQRMTVAPRPAPQPAPAAAPAPPRCEPRGKSGKCK